MENEQFLKVYLNFYKVVNHLKTYGLIALSILMFKITKEFIKGNIIEMNYNESLRYARQFLTEEELQKFTSSRFYDGMRELRDMKIIEKVFDRKNVYKFNFYLFRNGK